MFVACICALNVSQFILDLFGHPMIAYFVILNPLLPIYNIYLVCLIDFVVM